MWECQKCMFIVKDNPPAMEACPEGELHHWTYFELSSDGRLGSIEGDEDES